MPVFVRLEVRSLSKNKDMLMATCLSNARPSPSIGTCTAATWSHDFRSVFAASLTKTESVAQNWI